MMEVMRRPARHVLVALVLAFGAVNLPAPVSAGTGASPRPIAYIEIPALGVRQPVLSGITDAVYDRGVGHWPGTALPGQDGKMVLGGHRTVKPRPFWDIQKLRRGDLILLTRRGRTYTYAVTGYRVVRNDATWILDQTSDPVLTIFTCHPRGSTRFRYVVNAALRP